MRFISGRRGLCVVLLPFLCLLGSAAWANQDVVILLDSSASMTRGDPQHQGMRALTGFINGRGPDTRIALLSYGARPQRLAPFTQMNAAGRKKLDAALARVRFSGDTADVSAGLDRALAEILDHAAPQALKSIVLVAHAGAAGRAPSGADVAHWIERSLVPAANYNQVRVFSVVRSPPASGPLRTLSQESGGGFFSVLQPGDFGPAFKTLAPQLAKATLTPVLLPLPAAAVKFATPLTRAQPAAESAHWLWLVIVIVAVVVAAIAVYAVWNLRAPKIRKPRAGPAKPAGSGAHAVLYDISNPNDIRRFELDERAALLGRVAGYDPEVQYILVKEKTVGRCHAVIERRGHTFWLTDQGSVNGTFVNGERIAADRALKHGDIVAVHRHEFEFMIPDYFESDATVVGARETSAA